MTIRKSFCDSLIEALGVTIEVSKEDLEKFPKTVLYHGFQSPVRGLGWYRPGAFAVQVASDYKIMSNFL